MYRGLGGVRESKGKNHMEDLDVDGDNIKQDLEKNRMRRGGIYSTSSGQTQAAVVDKVMNLQVISNACAVFTS